MVTLLMRIIKLDLTTKFKTVFMAFLLNLLSTPVVANDIADFIHKAQVKTYDCPDNEDIVALEPYLSHPQISVQQSLELRTIKAQGLICLGQFQSALTLLNELILEPEINNKSYSFASAIYQIGFVFDVQEDPKRCDYYKQAESLARDKFNDVFLSAQLGQITVCDTETQDLSVKLSRLYALLEHFMTQNDQQAVAHIHNNIGLLYGSIGQNALAAEQYEKSYRIGLHVYEEKNQLAALFSVIGAYISSGGFDNAKLMIEELRRASQKVNTPLTNSWLYYSESLYFYQTGDYAAMRTSMNKWHIALSNVSNKQMDSIYDWYYAVLCLQDNDKECVAEFIKKRSAADALNSNNMSINREYLRFLVEANFFLGDVSKAEQVFKHYADSMHNKIRVQQSSARVMGVAKLHNEIITLEANLAKAEQDRIYSMLAVFAGICILCAGFYLIFGRPYMRKLGTDSLTGVRNEQSVLSAIKRLKKPLSGKINGLAVFDLTNFAQVNSQFGYMTSDLLLKTVANCLTQVTRERDIVGRLGADQFVVCLKNIDDRTATELFERIQKVLGDVVLASGSGDKINVHSSTSIYLSQDGFDDIDLLLEEMRQAEHKKSHVNHNAGANTSAAYSNLLSS